jgi:hypothetical protein
VMKLRSLAAAGMGAALAYWLDPDNGAGRRARMRSQLAARVRNLVAVGGRRLRYQKGVARGLVHEAVAGLRPERDFDDADLVQKVKSEAVGPWMQRTGYRGDVEVAASDGEVLLGGSIDDPDERRSLLRLVESVEGVRSVTDRLVSTSG